MATSLFTISLFRLALLSCYLIFVSGRPERGLWTNKISKDDGILFYVKSMYSQGQISIAMQCESKSDAKLKIKWLLRRSPCAQEFVGLNKTSVRMYLDNPDAFMSPSYNTFEYLNAEIKVNCHQDHQFYLDPFNYSQPHVKTRKTSTPEPEVPEVPQKLPVKINSTVPAATKAASKSRRDSVQQDSSNTDKRQKRDAETDKIKSSAKPITETVKPSAKPISQDHVKKDLENEGENFLKLWKDGYYLLVMEVSSDETDLPEDFEAEVTVKMMWNNNYISAVDWPLLIFYGVMGLVYIGFGIFWLFMLACNWRDLLRVQFWVGAVILLGMLEKAVFFAEYENINNEGQPVQGAIILAELVSCVKRGLARMLVIIVCLGFGIIKPRLGQTLHKVLIVGVTFTVLASIEGCMRATKARPDQSTEWMFAAVPLAVTDAIICWWVFSALLQTTRTLRLRRNIVKLSLYRHFTNTLIFAIIASVAYMIWFLTQHRFKQCITDWKELWVDEAFWHLLFSVILFIIMILWRPTANNQRYAFSPLLDAAEDDLEDDQVLSEAYEGMKMRSTKTQQRNGSPKAFDEKMEDDLKWVEENIPSSLTDKLLPALDSDEEIMNQKFEVSKME